MAQKVIDLTCPGCGSPTNTSETVCKFCGRQVVISTFNSVYDMPVPLLNKYAKTYNTYLGENPESTELNTTIAMCCLKLKLFGKALSSFEKVMENDFDNSKLYFYAAVCLLNGKKAFLVQHKDIKKALEYINVAIMIEPRGVYYYFSAYLKYDFYTRKCLNISPGYMKEMENAMNNHVSPADVGMLFELLGVDIPSEIKLE